MIRLALGFWFVLIGTGLAPELWSPQWWVLALGLFLAVSGGEILLRRRDGSES